MGVFRLYVLSKNDELNSFLPIMLTKLDVNVEICKNTSMLFKLCEGIVPNLLLIDDAQFLQEEIFDVLKEYLTYYKRNITNILLITDQKDTRAHVNYMFNGVDYFLSRPVNMMEIVARVNAIVQYQKRIRMIISYERNATTIDVMESISNYLSHHIKKPIQTFIDNDLKTADKEKIQNYLKIVRNGAGEVMAAVNAVRDEVSKLIASHEVIQDPSNELDELYKKNLAVITAAYQLDKEQK